MSLLSKALVGDKRQALLTSAFTPDRLAEKLMETFMVGHDSLMQLYPHLQNTTEHPHHQIALDVNKLFFERKYHEELFPKSFYLNLFSYDQLVDGLRPTFLHIEDHSLRLLASAIPKVKPIFGFTAHELIVDYVCDELKLQLQSYLDDFVKSRLIGGVNVKACVPCPFVLFEPYQHVDMFNNELTYTFQSKIGYIEYSK